jgi:hypothetical protein
MIDKYQLTDVEHLIREYIFTSILDMFETNGTNMLTTNKTMAVCQNLPTNIDQEVTPVDVMEEYICGKAKGDNKVGRVLAVAPVLLACGMYIGDAIVSTAIGYFVGKAIEKAISEEPVMCKAV